MDTAKHSQRRILGVDGLRAFAVLSVIGFHLNHSFLPGGFTGVDVFFVISGYVVCGSLLKDSGIRFLPFIGAFYVRRLLRIYPALIVMLVTCGILSTLFIPTAYLSLGNRVVGSWAFFGLSNIALVRSHNDYFSPTNDYNPYAHTWSLGVEEQFYVFFPLILFGIFRTTRRRIIATVTICALALLSFLFSIGQTRWHHESAYFLLPSRFWELAVGAILCLANRQGRLSPTSHRQSALVVTIGLIFLAVSTIFVNAVYFPFPLAILPVVGAFLCIAGLASPYASGMGVRILNLPVIVGIGRISYSLYLWHWVVIVLMRWTVGAEGIYSHLIAVALTFSLATASYFWLEAPIQQTYSFLKQRKLWALAAGACIVVMTRSAFNKLVDTRTQNLIGLSVVTRNRSDWYAKDHMGDDSGPLFPGTAGMHWSDKRLFSIGDSHAVAYGGLFRMLEERDGVSVLIDSGLGQTVGSLVTAPDSNAAGREAEIFENLARYARPGDVVLLANLRVPRFCEQWGEVPKQEITADTERIRRIAVRDGERFIGKLRQLQLRVVIDAPKPVFKSPPFRCADWFNRMNPIGRPGFSVERDFLLAHRETAMKSIHEVQMKFSDILVWDPFWIFCSGTNCSAFDGSKPMFFDGDHLTDYGGRMLYPSFKAVLEKVWNRASRDRTD